MSWLSKLRASLAGIDPETLNAYRSAIPSTINVQVNQKADTFIATIISVENEKLPKEVFLVTEAPSKDSLVDMVNDLVFTYKNIPENYRPYYKQILRPEGAVSRTDNLKLVKSA